MVAAEKPAGEVFTTTVSSKGQVVIPKAMRERLGLRSGDVLEVEEVEGALLLRVQHEDPAALKARLFGPPVPLETLAGRLAHLAQPGPVPSMREMREQARAEFARRWAERETRYSDDTDDSDEVGGDE